MADTDGSQSGDAAQAFEHLTPSEKMIAAYLAVAQCNTTPDHLGQQFCCNNPRLICLETLVHG
jgi:hypothetical protein